MLCRLLTTDPSQLKDELPGDLQSLSWLTSVDVPRLQQIGGGRPDFTSSAQNSLLERQTGQEELLHTLWTFRIKMSLKQTRDIILDLHYN